MNRSNFAIQIDELALAKARKGDMEAMEYLYRTYSSAVYSLALRITSSNADAEDITQDTFIEVFKKLDQFKGSAPFWAWLRRIAINTTLMKLRRDKNLPLSLDEMEEQPEILIQTDRAANLHDLEKVLNKLSVTARAVVWLHDIEGYTHDEIGKMMDKTPSFSKSQLSRAYDKLRSILKWQNTATTNIQLQQRC
ncbi:MAG: sigma-70 family RNA polymerase sigma factor [Gammaproteobacteria bacterium]|jgi:RNA polymerase sigma-70 factor (ECF subfamily)|nr:sigma-70 family RNA polymerase sigma factor [Gammaproteobacteria bacterium]MBT3722328.1 sigma-70 family RNA polymerase sigma factor [Gammaproteobacteria bacterium]MBT4193909.1 sigma-70 family RNA polymerase sigma factor [Gammaproteobacteria bacterium]MBT4448375.1 sigma-70 family RNA polymerase sigma factor [Gammaproteobacteria bacterium]MBT4862908.1 sigma-70 family RNA polymerase sigma factor [Gammaproteobacteria bacterium]